MTQEQHPFDVEIGVPEFKVQVSADGGYGLFVRKADYVALMRERDSLKAPLPELTDRTALMQEALQHIRFTSHCVDSRGVAERALAGLPPLSASVTNNAEALTRARHGMPQPGSTPGASAPQSAKRRCTFPDCNCPVSSKGEPDCPREAVSTSGTPEDILQTWDDLVDGIVEYVGIGTRAKLDKIDRYLRSAIGERKE